MQKRSKNDHRILNICTESYKTMEKCLQNYERKLFKIQNSIPSQTTNQV